MIKFQNYLNQVYSDYNFRSRTLYVHVSHVSHRFRQSSEDTCSFQQGKNIS